MTGGPEKQVPSVERKPERQTGNLTLPIWQVMPEAIEKLKAHKRLILSSPTGSGKSTQLPQALVQAGFHKDGKIIVVQNRVAVAVEVAKRVAEEMGEEVGKRVGYVTGPEKNSNPNADIIFMTAGVFKHKIRNDPSLRDTSVVIFDEFDERQLLMDFGVALADKAQENGSSAKMVLMSATLNAQKLAAHFEDAPTVEAAGRLHPVSEHFNNKVLQAYDMPQATAEKAREIHASGKEGDILIFMPGKSEIQETINALTKGGITGATILPLHSEMSAEDRHRIFESATGRKIIVSTDIAERGLTIDGVRFVIDSGLARKTSYDPQSDTSRLLVGECAKDSLKQRAGRAGRTASGEYHALFTQANYDKRAAATRPEITAVPLREVILQIKAMGYSREKDPLRILDYDLIGKANWKEAKNQLRLLGALDPQDDTRLSKLGETIAEFGCDPRDGAMIIKAAELGCSEEAVIVAAIRMSRPLLRRGRNLPEEVTKAYQQFPKSKDSDLLSMLAIYRAAEQVGFNSAWCKKNHISWLALRDIRQNITRIFEGMQRAGVARNHNGNSEALCKAIAAGFPDKVFTKTGRRGWYYNQTTGVRARLGRESTVNADAIIASKMIGTEAGAFIGEATRILPEESPRG